MRGRVRRLGCRLAQLPTSSEEDADMTAVALAPGVWRIPTMPFDLVNSFLFADDDGSLLRAP